MDTKTRTRRNMSIMAAIGLVSLVIAPASGFDSTPPSLDSATISQGQVPDAGGSVTVTLKITSKTGLANNVVIMISLEGDASRQLAAGVLPLTSGDSKSGIYSKEFQISSGLKPGVYQLVVFPLTDTSQNSTPFIFTNSYLTYGNVVSASPAPTPSSSASPLVIPTSNASDLITISKLNSSVDRLNSTIEHLRVCLASAKKIISSKKGNLPGNC